MRLFRLALCGVCLSAAGLRGQQSAQDSEAKEAPPEEIPDFSQLDEYTYVPKSTLSIGSRLVLQGPKTTFSGQGSIPATTFPGTDPTVPNVQRTYSDGYINPDGRTIVVTDGIGPGTVVAGASDGRTNTWGYDNSSQILPNGDIAFHSYSAEVTDRGSHEKTGDSSAGIELVMDRDMGKLGKRMKWSITAGLSLADLRSSVGSSVPATLTATTDVYDLFGQVPPLPVFNSPSSFTQVSGTVSESPDQTILIGNVPIAGGRSVTNTPVSVTNTYYSRGAYYTFRIGPTVTLPITKHLNFNVSIGPTIIYSGSEMNVLEDLAFTTNEPDLTDLYQKENNRLVPGYYVDVDMQYQLTDTAGFYVGG
ncbi:MAG TPA: hypothetical protein VN877_03280, partial [Opitutaceae bacterium]|nr:hypothetical protein [Opitutaceae bacterium]